MPKNTLHHESPGPIDNPDTESMEPIHNAQLKGRYAIVKASEMDAEFQAIRERAALICDGFGCTPGLGGSACFVQFSDRSEARFERGQFERFATPDEIAEFQEMWEH